MKRDEAVKPDAMVLSGASLSVSYGGPRLAEALSTSHISCAFLWVDGRLVCGMRR